MPRSRSGDATHDCTVQVFSVMLTCTALMCGSLGQRKEHEEIVWDSVLCIEEALKEDGLPFPMTSF